ncbi:MAG: GHKL domain-containing protein [Desulfobacteraceae bacterium]|nr:GHKL domain-containing protein [Desulfobacteraceae bacterium]
MAKQILFIDSELKYAKILKTHIERQDYNVTTAACFVQARQALEKPIWDIIIANPFIDVKIVPCLISAKETNSFMQIIILASRGKLETAMDLLGACALQYLESPISNKALDLAITSACKNIAMNQKISRYSEKIVNLHKEHDLLNQLFEEVPCYISVQDKHLRITAANKKFKYHFGNRVGGFCYEIYKHRTSQCSDCPVVKTFHDGKSYCTEEVLTTQLGKQYNVLTQTAPIRDEYGDISQVMEMSTNITQIRELQDHLISLGLMLGSMSHGVKGMLTALDGGIYQLEMGIGQKDNDRIVKAYGQIKLMAGRIKKMALEMLYYTKSRELDYKKINIKDFSQKVVNTIKTSAKNHAITLDISILENLGKFEIDSNWMDAALVSFLENAIDACVLDQDKKKHTIKFTVQKKPKERLCFTIKDNGIGMDTETKNKMFTLFFTSKGSQGTGLGLFIAHKVIGYHGGTVEIESRKGKGSTFDICLPILKPNNIKTPIN